MDEALAVFLGLAIVGLFYLGASTPVVEQLADMVFTLEPSFALSVRVDGACVMLRMGA